MPARLRLEEEEDKTKRKNKKRKRNTIIIIISMCVHRHRAYLCPVSQSRTGCASIAAQQPHHPSTVGGGHFGLMIFFFVFLHSSASNNWRCVFFSVCVCVPCATMKTEECSQAHHKHVACVLRSMFNYLAINGLMCVHTPHNHLRCLQSSLLFLSNSWLQFSFLICCWCCCLLPHTIISCDNKLNEKCSRKRNCNLRFDFFSYLRAMHMGTSHYCVNHLMIASENECVRRIRWNQFRLRISCRRWWCHTLSA